MPKILSSLFQVEGSTMLPESSGYSYYFTAPGQQGWRRLKSDPPEQLGCPGDTVCHWLDCHHHHHHHVLLAGSSTCAGPMHPGETPCTLLLLTDEPSPPFPVFPSLQEANGPKGLTPEKRGKKAQHIKTKQNKPIRNQESPCGSLQSAKSNKGRGRGFTSVV